MDSANKPDEASAAPIGSAPASPTLQPILPDQNPFQGRGDEGRDQKDSFGEIDDRIPQVATIKRFFRKAGARGVSATNFSAYISTNLRLDTLISAKAQSERYICNAAREALEAALWSCSPPNIAHNSRIIYCVIRTIWPDTQGNILRRFNVMKRKVSSNSRHQTRSEPSITTNTAPQYYPN